MRTLFRTLVLALLLARGAAHADETAPPKEEPKAPAPTAEEPKEPTKTEPIKTEDGATPETAKDALARIRSEAGKAGPKGGDVARQLSEAFLVAAEKRGAAFPGEERMPFAIIQAMSGKRSNAVETLRGLATDEGAPEGARDEARGAFVELSLALVRNKEIPADKVAPTLAEAEETLLAIHGDKMKERRGQLRMLLAMAYRNAERPDDAMRHYAEAGVENPLFAPQAASAVVEHFLEHAKGPDDYPKTRESARPILAKFTDALDAAVVAARAKNDEPALKRLDSTKKRLASASVPLEIIGNPLPAWTAVHPFKGGASPADYKGKVLLVDFWATWCPWCIKSFPAMRDLLKEYGEKGFAIVGVTTSSDNVYDARYDLDEDVKAKMPADWKPKLTLRLAKDATAEAKTEHAAKEKEVVATFVANHEIPWDLVMIEGEEPAAKYGLSGWPYGILVDRQGRIRRLHAGAILREDAPGMAEMRKLIESLLAEPADVTPEASTKKP